MADTELEVIKANLVLVGIRLLGTPDDIESFRRSVGTDVQLSGVGMGVNIQTGIAEPGFSLTLSRDRITLESSSSRSTIFRDYPSRENIPTLASVAWQAIGNTSIGEQKLRSFGFNVELIFDQKSQATAFEYLSRRLFDVESLGNEGWQFVGGAGRIVFSDGDRRWTLSLEPRFNDAAETRVFLSVNLHKDEQVLPSEDEIRKSLEEVWDEVHDFVQRLDMWEE